MCPGTSLLQFPYLNSGTMLHEFFERITNLEYKESPHFMVSDVHFPPKYLSWKDCLPAFLHHPPQKKLMSNNYHFFFMKLIRKLSDT